MTSKRDTTAAAAKKDTARKRRMTTYNHSAEQKAQAVLAVWTERVKVAEVMKSLGVPYMTLQQWQERALEGMLQALEPRTNLADGGALSPRLKSLLARRRTEETKGKLKSRLQKLQEVAPPSPQPSTA
jgi:transposase-like protein